MKKFLLTLLILPTLLFAKENIVLTKKNHILFGDDFTSQYVSEKMIEFMSKASPTTYVEMAKEFVKNPTVYLILNSPGGSIEAGLEFIQFINAYSNIEVKTVTLFAASMGFHTVEAINGERLIAEHGTLMSHMARGGFSGEFGMPGSQIDNRYNYWLRRLHKLDEKIAKRSKKYTLTSYRDLMRDEYWCEGQDCVEDGFADRVVGISCAKDLSGYENKTITLNYFGTQVEVMYKDPNCPLAYPFDIKISTGNITTTIDNETTVTEKMRDFILNEIMPTSTYKVDFNN